jgi:hypothetical protein
VAEIGDCRSELIDLQAAEWQDKQDEILKDKGSQADKRASK